MMDGIININKDKGYTSHDVVAVLRRLLNIRKIGHTGTLDPDATGVLPVCVGKATKVCDIITDRDKTYEAKVLLGVTTDTLDTSGEILSKNEVDASEDDIKDALDFFKGEIEQIPPMYSAIKVDGKKLYEYARAGVEIERKSRKVTIHDIELLGVELPYFSIRVKCSKGTYIRTLCDDIGSKLGCGAAMSELVRTAVGRFKIEDALTLSDVEKRLTDEKIFLRIDDVFDMYPKAVVKPEAMKLLLNGNPISLDSVVADERSKIYRIYDDKGEFYALYKAKGNRLVVEKNFH